jgi:hypothetical protein
MATNSPTTSVKATPFEVAAAAAAEALHQQDVGSRWSLSPSDRQIGTLCTCGRAWRDGLHRDQKVAEAVIEAYRQRRDHAGEGVVDQRRGEGVASPGERDVETDDA